MLCFWCSLWKNVQRVNLGAGPLCSLFSKQHWSPQNTSQCLLKTRTSHLGTTNCLQESQVSINSRHYISLLKNILAIFLLKRKKTIHLKSHSPQDKTQNSAKNSALKTLFCPLIVKQKHFSMQNWEQTSWAKFPEWKGNILTEELP